ncbi:tetratricopeptide repeat protein [Streptomyces sp. NBC_01754]|uniref:AfsR/SARP family transcriptional regulator n=1 Tax=Streptomyces sp. NBC_01754 TaxID=2975930 RepID=UPI002DDB558B|nr:BTAD domain-containing putative transcriptional regulator [Streptomyces sp. NBC_01754]WSC90864.1 tetratricopeptide repeat protein [Streptomyces sp. NBC_01754]WSC96641.1 tetratricopeptide repeat protein [Streptomyces sp. NBC_01754]
MTASEVRSLRFNVLGPLEGWAGGSRLRLGGLIQERVLGTLLLESGRVLPIGRLVESAWAEDPPATASHQVRKAVADLRRRIPSGSDVIVTDGPGYRVVLGTEQLDLTEFGSLVRTARDAPAEGRAAEAVEALRRALGLWRGPILAGAGGSVIEAAATVFEERRLAAAEHLFELRLGLGESTELVVDLRDLVQAHPLHESLRAQLMLTLYRSGRQAEALEEYSRVRELLVEELGVDPGPRLTRVYEGILRDSPELAAPAPPADAAPLPRPVPAAPGAPCTLPYDLADFTGRGEELQELLDSAGRDYARHSRIVALDGMGGSGKTSLAVHAAHTLAGDFPDGQLYLDLRGYTPGEQPVTASGALDSLLRALGVPGARIPEDAAGRTALWRSTVAGKRLLLLLDNAADADGVRPLLPTSPGCLVLVTSRARLVDLDSAQWISVDVMSPTECAALIAETLGEQRYAAEPESAAELARLCGHLPLALRIATARLRNRPRWTLRYLADRLRDETRRLDELSSGQRSVAATLRLSYQALPQDCRTAFRSVALHPGGDLDVHAAAALLDADPMDAEGILELLLDVHLLQQPEIGLYTFHDLVRSFAQSLRAPATDGDDAASTRRLLDYYLAATESACQVMFPGRRPLPTEVAEVDDAEAWASRLPWFADSGQAEQWFAREQGSLLGAVGLADRAGHDRHTVFLARNLAFQLSSRGQLEEFRSIGLVAVAAARRLGVLPLLGISLSNLGVACWKLGRFAEGIEGATEGREVAERLGDVQTLAHSESTLGQLNSLLGRFPRALSHLEKAIALQRELGASRAEAESLTLLSTLYEQWGRHEEAASAARRAISLCDELGRHKNKLVALTDLAFAHACLGDDEAADLCLSQARELCTESSDPGQVALALALLAEVTQRLGRPEQAAHYADRAIETIGPNVSLLRRAKVENTVGRYLFKRKEYEAALRLHERAHEAARSLDFRIEVAYALSGMARVQAALGLTEDAARNEHLAEELFGQMGVPADRRRS